MSLISYAVRPVADWTVGILVCTFVAMPFAQGYFGASTDQLSDMLMSEIDTLSSMLLPPNRGGGGNENQSIMNTASQWIGKTEDADRQELTAFIKKAGITINPGNTAWCAAFVNAVLYVNNIQGTGAVDARSFLQWGMDTRHPQQGDIVVLWRGSPSSWKGHVGFFKGVDAAGNVLILGGNQSDRVSIEAFSPSRVLSYRTRQLGN